MIYRYELTDGRKSTDSIAICIADMGGGVPFGAEPVQTPFSPMVFSVNRDPIHSRGIYAITDMAEVNEKEGINLLLPVKPDESHPLSDFVKRHGATVINTAFSNAYGVLYRMLHRERKGLIVELVGLGDVGGTLLTALKLLGGQNIDEIHIYDFNQQQCRRYEIELNQVLGIEKPRILVKSFENLFEGDLFLFTASRGVPPVGTEGDVRMLQFDKNREMLASYAALARKKRYDGLFCQISDPVDLLARSVFLMSNREEEDYDFAGLLPEQVLGFGLGVMAARAGYLAEKHGLEHSELTVFGPHGKGLVVANDSRNYDDEISRMLTEETVHANMLIRDLGYKPYIAPALSSACISILDMLNGKEFFATAPLNGIYFGSRMTYAVNGVRRIRQEIAPGLLNRIQETMNALGKEEDACRK